MDATVFGNAKDEKRMTYTIYALVDPNTREVRYVGQTGLTVAKRLRYHLWTARKDPRPVYEWMRGLRPAAPIIVILQHIERPAGPVDPGDNSVLRAEIKWMKRFERSPLLCSINRNCRAYRELVNR